MLRGLHAHHVAHLPHRFHGEATEAELRDFVAAALAGGAEALVYRTGGVPRGYLLWNRHPPGPPILLHARNLAVLDHVWVEPGWRRQGIAARLVARFEDVAAQAGATGWMSRVHAFNRASSALMEEAGAVLSVRVYEKALPGAG